MASLTARYLPFVVLALWIAVVGYAVFRDPVQIGPDEGMEHAKALLVAKQPEMVKSEWNDQTWFYSYIFGRLVRADLTCMRVLTLTLFAITLFYLAIAVSRSHGSLAALVSVVSLLSWAGIPKLAISAMLEVPSASLAMLSGLLVLVHERDHSRAWIYLLAGVLTGVAVAIKLTSVLLLPFTVTALLWRYPGENSWKSLSRQIRLKLLPWGLSSVVVLMLCMIPGHSSLSHVIASHLKASYAVGSGAKQYAPGWEDFLPAAGTCALAAAAFLFWQNVHPKRLAGAAGAAVLIVSVVYSIHRPFWWFYRVHFAFPASILAGVGLSACIPTIKSRPSAAAFRAFFGLAACCLWLTTNCVMGWLELFKLCELHTVRDDAMLAEILSFRSVAGYGFSYEDILLSQAGRLKVPGLTVLAKKRYWTGDITEEEVQDAVIKAKPVLIILNATALEESGWQKITTNDYVRCFTQENSALFVRKDLNPVPEKRSSDRIRAIGL